MTKGEEAVVVHRCTGKVLVVCGKDVSTGVISDNCVGMEEEAFQHIKNRASSTVEDVLGRESMDEYSSLWYWRFLLDEVFHGDVDFGYSFDEEKGKEVTRKEEETGDIVCDVDKEVVDVDIDENIEFSGYNYWNEEMHSSELLCIYLIPGNKTQEMNKDEVDDEEEEKNFSIDIVDIVS